MNTNLRKFLYLGAGMLLFALALTQFFVNYHSYQAYVDTSINMSQQDRVVTVLEDNPCTYVHGYDLIHLILEEQKRVGLEKLNKEYYDVEPPLQRGCSIWIGSEEAYLTDPSKVDLNALYTVSYEFDTHGNVVKAYYNPK
ncbi:MAG: hypothetical protein ACOYEI_00735 [Acetivibrionales bacterium]|jgi:hypothetical protein|nr:hypothetical protein [Clostridiaceae bacterium]